MRRLRQQLPDAETRQILLRGKVAVWAVDGDDGYPYAVPVNYVYDGGEHVYIHCARQGHKLDAIRRNPKCSLCVVDKDDVVPEEFTSYFRSVIAFGVAETIECDADKAAALRLLCDKYCEGIDPTQEIDRLLKAVCVVRITLGTFTGKEAIELTRMRQGS